MRNNF